MNKALKWTGIGCGGFIGLLALLMVIGLLAPKQPETQQPQAAASPEPTPTESPAPSPTATASPENTDRKLYGAIGDKDETGTTVTVEVPDEEVCREPGRKLRSPVFEKCLVEGLTYVQVVNLLGAGKGSLVQESGNLKTYQWGSTSRGLITISFVDYKLRSKNQVNLRF